MSSLYLPRPVGPDSFDLEAALAEVDERCVDYPIYEEVGISSSPSRVRLPSLAISSIYQESSKYDEEAIKLRKDDWHEKRSMHSRKSSLMLSPSSAVQMGRTHSQSSATKPPLDSAVSRRSRISLKITPATHQSSLLKQFSHLKSPELITRAPSVNPSPLNSQSKLKRRNLLEFARRQSDPALVEISPGSNVRSLTSSRLQSPAPAPKYSERRNDTLLSPTRSNCSSFNDYYLSSGRSSAESEVPRLFTTTSVVSDTEPPRLATSLIKRSEIVVKQVVSNDCLQVNQYILENKIGKGSYGIVYSARDTEVGERRAVKVFNKKQMKRQFLGKHTSLHVLRNEIETMSALSHPNIIRTYEVIESEHKNNVYFVLELAANGSMSEVCPMSELDAWTYFTQLISAVDYLHNEAKVVHRDIKPQNLLLDSDFKLKLVDFGTAQSIRIKETLTNVSGTHAFMAPELVTNAKPFDGRALDVWAAGVTLYYFVEGCTPFSSRKIPKLYEEIESKSVNYPARIGKPLRDLLERMLQKDPTKRIQVNEIKEHPWVKRVPAKC